MLKEFRDFLLRGNLLELAVALVLGAAFGAVVNSLVKNIIMPIVGAVFGKVSFDSLTFTIHKSVFHYGTFITDVIAFVFVAAAIFFFVIKPVTAILRRSGHLKEDDAPEADVHGDLLKDIKALLERQNELLNK
ncbi:MAG: large conductance mechanosensitive channel protein MscL [Thermoleophilia bacterium]